MDDRTQVIEQLWRKLGLLVPDFHFLEPSQLPDAYRGLLAHESGMTATLEQHWGGPIEIELLADDIVTEQRSLFRFVVLRLRQTRLAVELATIRIPLDHFDPSIRANFIEGVRPFGALLADAGIRFRGRPIAYFSLAADSLAATKTNIPVGTALYGRINQLIGESGEVLCETVEMLPRA